MKIGSNHVPDTGKFQKRKRVKDLNIGERWTFRIVNGPMHRFFHMWPTMASDAVTGVIKPTWRGVTVDENESNVLDKLAEIDRQLKGRHLKATGGDEKQARSMLKKSDRFDYACIFRTPGKAPEVEVMEANWQVHDKINQLKNMKDPVKPDYLMYGLPFMYDIVLEKRDDPKTHRPNYIVQVHPASLKTSGLVHTGFLDQVKNPFPNPEQFFSAEDLATIQACNFELEDLDKPISADKVLEFIRANPIDLGRREKQNPGIFMFFNNMNDLQAIQDYAKNAGVNCAMPNQQDLSTIGQNQSSAPAALPASTRAVDAQFTVEPPQAPAFAPAPVQTPPPAFNPPPAPQVPPQPVSPAPAFNPPPTFNPPPGAPVFNPAPQPGPAMPPFNPPYTPAAPMAERVPPVRPDAAGTAASAVPTFTPAPAPAPAFPPPGAPAPAATFPPPGGATLPPIPDLW